MRPHSIMPMENILADVSVAAQPTAWSVCITRRFPSIKKNKKKEEKTGTITKQHIEENREILKDMQEEARSETHEPT